MKQKIFYGWWLLAGLFLIYAASNGIGLNTLPLFYPALREAFGWTEAEVTSPATLMYLSVAVISPFVGYMLDRLNTKVIMIVGSVGLVSGLVFYGMVNSLGQLKGVYLLYAFALTTAGIIPSMYLITKWFSRYRGLAVGIFLMASSVGGSIFPPLTGFMIESQGWRQAAFILAVIAGIMILIPVILLVRNSPQSMGLLPDGISKEESAKREKSDLSNYSAGLSLGEALRSSTFYILLFVTASMWFCITGVINNQTLYFDDLSISDKISGLVLGLFFLSSLSGKFLFGYLSDRFNKKYIMLVATINLTIGSVMLSFIMADNAFTLYGYAIIYGIGFSGAFTMIQVMVAQYYQGKAYGSILGIVTGIDTFAGSMGIVILSSMRTKIGSYLPSFYLMIGICVLACICVLLLPNTDRSNVARS